MRVVDKTRKFASQIGRETIFKAKPPDKPERHLKKKHHARTEGNSLASTFTPSFAGRTGTTTATARTFSGSTIMSHGTTARECQKIELIRRSIR